MEKIRFRKYYLFSLLGVILASLYPIYMGASVVADMIRYGSVHAGDYPKYIIPYTPIAFSLIIGVALMPLIIKGVKKFALLCATVLSVAAFFASELMLESMVIVKRTVTEIVPVKLGDWQMYTCAYFGGFEKRTYTEVDILMGEYSPLFKLHFYIISVVLIISILNCFYGFAKMIKTGDGSRKVPLILQSVASGAFLGMCVWACFTAFYRTGEIRVSPLSATLMGVFFALFGITVGIYLISFTLRRRRSVSILLPSVAASAVTLVMYFGEMILLGGNIYRFGEGFFFDGIPAIVFAPIDICVILISGAITAVTSVLIRINKTK